MISKLCVVEEEADESLYWRELLVEAGTMPNARLAELMLGANAITATTVSSIENLAGQTFRQSKI
jgi:hypothetical protein